MTTPHVPSKESVERCARAIRNTFETDDDREFGSGYFSAHAISEDDVSTWAEAVLRCAVEEAGYADPDVFDGQKTIIELLQDQCRYEKERAEKAEAECLELRKALRDYEKNAGRFGRDGE